MLEARKQEIADAVIHQIETAGRGGFSALCYFGIFHPRAPGTRRLGRAGLLVVAIGSSFDELAEFRAELSPEMLERIKEAQVKWGEVMSAYWERRSNEIEVELAGKTKAGG